MAIASGTIWELRTTATANSVNGGGFNPTNANFLTDLTTDSNTGNTSSPVVSSVSYNFVAGDVGAKVYIKDGTNWTKGWYNIASVASNKATLQAAIGEGVNNTNGYFTANTTVGVASVGTPTGGTFGIDYSQQDGAIISGTDLASADGDASPCIVTSAGTPFGVNHVGNIINVTDGTGYTVNRYEIVSVSGVNATLDRAVGTNGAKVDGTFYVGGAISLNSTLDDDFFEVPVNGNFIFVKNGTFVIGETISVSNNNKWHLIGYNSYRGDEPTGTNRPTIACGAIQIVLSTTKSIRNLILTTTATDGLTVTGCRVSNVKILNTSTTASRKAYVTAGASVFTYNSEFVSQNGYAVYSDTAGAYSLFDSCYIHDSDTNVYLPSVSFNIFSNCIFHAGRTNNYSVTTDLHIVKNCTFYGRSSKIGVGALLASTSNNCNIIDSIFSGLTTAISQLTTPDPSNIQSGNNFYNNTTDLSNISSHPDTLALDPQFTAVSEISGSTATSSGSVLTQSGGDFSSVVDNESYLHIISGTGVTANRGYLITSHDATTLTVNNSLGTSAAGDIVYFVTVGRNFKIGTNLKAQGNVALNSYTTSYVDLGASQREEASGGGCGGIFIC